MNAERIYCGRISAFAVACAGRILRKYMQPYDIFVIFGLLQPTNTFIDFS